MWADLTMDFITNLPLSRCGQEVYNLILVIMDRNMKMVHYVPVRKTIGAEELADVFLQEIHCLHGMPDLIVTDRGSVFTSHFWLVVCFFLGVQ